MLNTEVDPLGDDSATNSLIHNDSEGMGCDIVDATGLSVVDFVWHTLLDCTIALKLKMVMSVGDFDKLMPCNYVVSSGL